MYANSSCVLIKPHAVREGKAGRIIKAITDTGMDIAAISMFKFVCVCVCVCKCAYVCVSACVRVNERDNNNQQQH